MGRAWRLRTGSRTSASRAGQPDWQRERSPWGLPFGLRRESHRLVTVRPHLGSPISALRRAKRLEPGRSLAGGWAKPDSDDPQSCRGRPFPRWDRPTHRLADPGPTRILLRSGLLEGGRRQSRTRPHRARSRLDHPFRRPSGAAHPEGGSRPGWRLRSRGPRGVLRARAQLLASRQRLWCRCDGTDGAPVGSGTSLPRTARRLRRVPGASELHHHRQPDERRHHPASHMGREAPPGSGARDRLSGDPRPRIRSVLVLALDGGQQPPRFLQAAPSGHEGSPRAVWLHRIRCGPPGQDRAFGSRHPADLWGLLDVRHQPGSQDLLEPHRIEAHRQSVGLEVRELRERFRELHRPLPVRTHHRQPGRVPRAPDRRLLDSRRRGDDHRHRPRGGRWNLRAHHPSHGWHPSRQRNDPRHLVCPLQSTSDVLLDHLERRQPTESPFQPSIWSGTRRPSTT
jgi:hypothetical protein